MGEESWSYVCEVCKKEFQAKPFKVLRLCDDHEKEFDDWVNKKAQTKTTKEEGLVSDCCHSVNYLIREGKNGEYYVCEGCHQTCALTHKPNKKEEL